MNQREIKKKVIEILEQDFPLEGFANDALRGMAIIEKQTGAKIFSFTAERILELFEEEKQKSLTEKIKEIEGLVKPVFAKDILDENKPFGEKERTEANETLIVNQSLSQVLSILNQ